MFEQSGGSPVRAYLLLKQNGSPNIPPAWIERASGSRKKREKELATILKKGGIQDFPKIEEWEVAYQKECFYYGIRVLLELERKGKTKL